MKLMGGSSPLTRGKHCGRYWCAGRGRLIPTHAGKTLSSRKVARPIRAHPHSRGENRYTATYQVTAKGSSPLTRGKLPDTAVGVGRERLIPTHAGKTRSCPWAWVRSGAHPHSRGENLDKGASGLMASGSSPLTRGKHAAESPAGHRSGLIPTHAGKTASFTGPRERSWAHPHSRGENTYNLPNYTGDLGSSPLTRGKRVLVDPLNERTGLIPTHAGKTFRRRCRRWPDGAHPHSRGENHTSGGLSRVGQGSSPLTRGKPRPRLRSRSGERLIPTHAGKTSEVQAGNGGVRAHPHSRGENFLASRACTSDPGSSPLTRGKHLQPAQLHRRPGLIPTHAGKTRRCCSTASSPWAHPHSRGENSPPSRIDAGHAGSSPLTRGKREAGNFVPGSWGLIPTHAGKTSSRPARP